MFFYSPLWGFGYGLTIKTLSIILVILRQLQNYMKFILSYKILLTEKMHIKLIILIFNSDHFNTHSYLKIPKIKDVRLLGLD